MEQAYEELHHEEVMRQATLTQCIYVFVEGESEEVAFPLLLERAGIDFEKDGIVIANYNGINNLPHVLRIMAKTLSYDRPIIVTYDNDLDGQRISRKISQYASSSHIAFQTIPSNEVVTFKNGHNGGSFEEAFEPSYFIHTCFSNKFMPESISKRKSQFLVEFDVRKPWLSQVCQFCQLNGYKTFGDCKVKLAETLALYCSNIPPSFKELAELIKITRQSHPVRHPDDVDLPQIKGLTC